MIVLYSVIAFATTYVFLRKSGGVVRYLIALFVIAIVTTIMQALTLEFLLPFGGYTIDMLNYEVISTVGGIWPAVAAPILGMIVATIVREKRKSQDVV